MKRIVLVTVLSLLVGWILGVAILLATVELLDDGKVFDTEWL